MTEPESSDQRDLSCQTFVALITEYLEGTLDPTTEDLVRKHLESCPHCETYLEQMRTTMDALGHVPVETLSEQARIDIVTAFRGLGDVSNPRRC